MCSSIKADVVTIESNENSRKNSEELGETEDNDANENPTVSSAVDLNVFESNLGDLNREERHLPSKKVSGSNRIVSTNR